MNKCTFISLDSDIDPVMTLHFCLDYKDANEIQSRIAPNDTKRNCNAIKMRVTSSVVIDIKPKNLEDLHAPR